MAGVSAVAPWPSLSRALRAPRAHTARTPEEDRFLRRRHARYRRRHRHLSRAAHPERAVHALGHRGHRAGVLVRRTGARLARAQAARTVPAARAALAQAAALGQGRRNRCLERARSARELCRLPAGERLAMAKNVFDKPDKNVRLDDISAEPPGGMTREQAEKRFERLSEELFALQDMMWGAKLHSLLIVLQGRDAAGKDGTIKHVAGSLNPRGVSVVSFGVPTAEERQHDFLWRVHRHAPRLGEVAIFNRSHYEDVLVVRVHGLVPKKLWKARYRHIADFEALLAEHNTIVLKYFLHITKKEQKERLLEREQEAKS